MEKWVCEYIIIPYPISIRLYVLRFRDFPEPIRWPGDRTINPTNFLDGRPGFLGVWHIDLKSNLGDIMIYLELSIHISSEMFWGYVVFLQKTNGEETTTKHGESKKRAIFSETIGPFCLPKNPTENKTHTHTQKKKRPIPETASQCWWADCDPYRWSKSPLVYRTGDSVATGLAHYQNDLKSVSLTLKIPRWRSYSDFWLGFAWPWCCGIRCFLEKVSKT